MNLYSQHFPCDNKTQPPLLVLHGLFGSSTNWRMLCKRFSITRECWAIDLRNHGQSPHADIMDFASMAADILEFMDQHNLAACDLLGHSMGGKVAMEIALNHPKLIQRLIVADIAPKAYPPRHQDVFEAISLIDKTDIRHRQDADKLTEKALPDQATRLFLLTNLARDEDGLFRWRLNMQAIRNHYEAISAAPPAAKSGQIFDGPVLFVRGGKSRYVLPEDEKLITTLFPGATITEIENAGHWVHAEQPETFFTLVENFLANKMHR